ncbi:AraC family transcriptional regulator [Micromonospora peucetia]|uniref:AraC family transcriptional regulator n=1 Tax=Micromonospora peucetia TaxID=47871 RepID=A0A1C6VVC8_9ACTN|nr:AraC family transcriptional regulator [Micromonospora peucetia]MCX4388067.1 AraC family transcriptional regulator [Micromonospora peucetia]WSA31245.1 AraC family transcriptional regulator [Micromonospora peucetia]SCL70182.1 Helix-turn-helix domain-containing protein [Micromonospora peucetia]
MEDVAERAVLRAIEAMRERLGDALTIDDLARAAMFSKFHFTRIFQRSTGVSPGRFLSALRLQRAKHLLVSTSMNVADISVQVGYNSVGTFSSRFSRSVGMPPTAYRRRAGYAAAIQAAADSPSCRSNARLSCRLRLPEPDETVIFVGMFAHQIPEGRPVRCAVLEEPGRVTFDSVPVGTWYLLAQSISLDGAGACAWTDIADRPVSVAAYGPFTVRADSEIVADLELRPTRDLDPPVLLALLDVRKYAMERLGEARKATRTEFERIAAVA